MFLLRNPKGSDFIAIHLKNVFVLVFFLTSNLSSGRRKSRARELYDVNKKVKVRCGHHIIKLATFTQCYFTIHSACS